MTLSIQRCMKAFQLPRSRCQSSPCRVKCYGDVTLGEVRVAMMRDCLKLRSAVVAPFQLVNTSSPIDDVAATIVA